VADDPDGQAAIERWLAVKDDLLAGREARPTGEGLAIRELCNRFLTAKKQLVDTGEIVPYTFADYQRICGLLVNGLGKRRIVADLTADDFAALRASLARTRGPVALGNTIQRMRMVFKFAYDQGLIDRPIRYGQSFNRPSKRVLRKQRTSNGPKMFEAGEIRALLDASPTPLRAMVYLGINCGLGNSDVGHLEFSNLDLDNGWLDFPRPKTGIPRRCPLWSETVGAIRTALAKRPAPKDNAYAGRVFITKRGGSWSKDTSDNPVSKEFAKVRAKSGLSAGRGFYCLRHAFETIGGDSRDQVAVDHIMGHARDDMASVYRERISDDRLRAVTDHVHKWLFGGSGEDD
jgi:integrase